MYTWPVCVCVCVFVSGEGLLITINNSRTIVKNSNLVLWNKSFLYVIVGSFVKHTVLQVKHTI